MPESSHSSNSSNCKNTGISVNCKIPCLWYGHTLYRGPSHLEYLHRTNVLFCLKGNSPCSLSVSPYKLFRFACVRRSVRNRPQTCCQRSDQSQRLQSVGNVFYSIQQECASTVTYNVRSVKHVRGKLSTKSRLREQTCGNYLTRAIKSDDNSVAVFYCY